MQPTNIGPIKPDHVANATGIAIAIRNKSVQGRCQNGTDRASVSVTVRM